MRESKPYRQVTERVGTFSRRVKSYLPKGRLFRSAALLSGSTLLTQIAGVCMAPVYARLYAPSDFGVFGQFYSIVCILLTVGCLCYELAIPTVADDEEALALAALSMICVAGISLLAVGWAVLSVWDISSEATHRYYFLLVPVGVLWSGFYRVAQHWALRVQALKEVATTTVKQMLGAQAVNLGFGLLQPSPLGLVLGHIVSSSGGATALARGTGLASLMRAKHRSIFRASRLWQVAKKHSRYAIIQSPSSLFNSLGFYLPGMLMLPFYGAGFAGQFNMAQRIGRLPVTLVGHSVSQVFFSEAATVARNDPARLRPLFNAISRKLLKLSLLVLIPCMSAPLLVPIIFGSQWKDAGLITIWLGFSLAFQMAVFPLSNIPNVVGRLKPQLIINIARAVLVFAALYVPYRLGMGGMVSVVCYSGAMMANYIACYVLYRHQVLSHAERNTRTIPLETPIPA